MAECPASVSAVRRLNAYRHEAALAVILGVLFVTAGIVSPEFLSFDAQRALSAHSWELALLTLPMMLIILTGGIDLSVGSTMALTAVAFGLAFQAHAGVGGAAAAALLTGAACGWVNGVCVTRFRVHPLIVTLATLSAYRGIAEGVSGGRAVSGFPASFGTLVSGTLLGVPLPGMLYAAVVAAVAVVLARTRWGTWFVAMGHGETAARYSAIPVDRIKLWLYTLSGTTAGVAAVLFAARRNTAKADVGLGIELEVITAVVLGGTSIFGGRGTVWGTALGFLLLHESREWVSWAFDSSEFNLLLVGTLLIASVLLQRLLPRGGTRATSTATPGADEIAPAASLR